MLKLKKCTCGGKAVLKGRVNKISGEKYYHIEIACTSCGMMIDLDIGTKRKTSLCPQMDKCNEAIEELWNDICA